MNRDLELLYEVGFFRRSHRTWDHLVLSETADNADHTFRVMWTALVITRMEQKRGAKVDETKILKMALLHDLPESRTGDVDYLSRQYTERNENQAVADIFKDTILQQEFATLWKEFEQRKSLEAKIVKDADGLDIDLELQELAAAGNNVRKKFAPHRRLNYEKIFHTKSAKQLWLQIQKSDPHSWHLNGRNRFNAGDWTKHRKKKRK